MEEGLAAHTHALHASFGSADRSRRPEAAMSAEPMPPDESTPQISETPHLAETEDGSTPDPNETAVPMDIDEATAALGGIEQVKSTENL